jgi:L-lactate dehydrogenase complex protein LldF
MTDLPHPAVRAAEGPGPAHATDVGTLRGDTPFPAAARTALANTQLRRNLGHATATIRAKRAAVVGEVPDWEQLRAAGAAVKRDTMARLPELLEQLERNVVARGGTVHWAADATSANAIVTRLVAAAGTPDDPVTRVVKVKSMATQEIGLNEALEAAGVAAVETDLAELIVQLGGDTPSHILVPAIHRNRSEIRQIFLDAMPGVDPGLTSEPRRLAMAAREHLRREFLAARVAVSGANFAVAETGTLAVVESEGNGRMCLTLPRTLITVMGIEKVIPAWRDLEVFLQLLPRSSTGERMNPYTSLWTGVTPGDGPQEFHLVLLDNGRTAALADEAGREALHCIRCSACLNVCPVYERVGGHAYGSVYPGPIGAVLTPQLTGMTGSAGGGPRGGRGGGNGGRKGGGHGDPVDTLPYASTLCGACFDACPVMIDIPSLLVRLRTRHVADERARRRERHRPPSAEQVAMTAAAWAMADPRRFAAAETAMGAGRLLARGGRIRRLPPPLAGWSAARDAPAPPPETFRQWWARRRGGAS